MQKVELLAPAGTMEALQAAVQNGCDAVYVGGMMFGARAFAGNFNNEEMQEAIAYVHSYGVKLYVTMNTLIFEDEIEEAFLYAKFLYEAGVDALIIQDLGLFDRLRCQLPDLELHASTQMHVHNVEGIRLLKAKGAHRIVLPRETTIEEVTLFTKEDIEFEVFVHGALCISYSGQCMMSEALFQRSGNRGQCAQACRMKYRLIKNTNGKDEIVATDGEYLLSPRDLNTLKKIPELIRAGITSFKIEGRMKRPAYVAQVVSLYRMAIDAYQRGEDFLVEEEMKKDLSLIFNRKFTQGNLFHQSGLSFMNAFRPNHLGIPIGKITKATSKKITILLTEDIHQGDGIRIIQTKKDYGLLLNKIYKNGLLVSEAHANECIELDCNEYIEKDSMVMKTSDSKQLQRLQQPRNRKVMVEVIGEFHIGKPMKLCVSDGVHKVIKTSLNAIEKAKTSALSKQRLYEQLAKCKDTPFEISNLQIDLEEQCFLSIKDINQLRRLAFDTLLQERIKRPIIEQVQPYAKKPLAYKNELSSTILIVHTEAQYQACRQEEFQPLYTTNKALANRYQLQYCAGSVEKQLDDSDFVCEVGGLTKKNGCIVQPTLYVTNAYTAAFFEEQGIQQIIFPYELNLERMDFLISNYKKNYQGNLQFGVEIYGYRDLMISEHCPIQTYEHTKQHCGLCKTSKYSLEDVKGQKFPLMGDEECRMHILSNHSYDNMDQIPALCNHNISVFQLRFRLENGEETRDTLQKFKRYFTDKKSNGILNTEVNI